MHSQYYQCYLICILSYKNRLVTFCQGSSPRGLRGKIRAIGAPWAIGKLPWPRLRRFVKVWVPVDQATPSIRCSRAGIQCGDAAAPDAMATPRRQSLASAQPDLYPPDCGRWQRPLCQPSSPVDVHCMSTGLSCFWRALCLFAPNVSVRNMRNRGLRRPSSSSGDRTLSRCLMAWHACQQGGSRTCRMPWLPGALGRSAYI